MTASVQWRRSTTVLLAALGLALAVTLALVAPASAHEEEGSTEAGVLVRQAIALIVNTPGDKMAIEDKIDDALKSKKPAGVDLDLVKQAAEELDHGSLHRVRGLLEVSIGATPHMSGLGLKPIRETSGPPTGAAAQEALRLATGEETGTNVAVDGLKPKRRLDGGTWAALGVIALLAAAGVALSVRFRPPVPMRALRGEGRS